MSRSSACKLEEHRQQGLVKDGNHLGGSKGGSSKQITMASKCGSMHPLGRGLNQRQGQWLYEYVTVRRNDGRRLVLRKNACVTRAKIGHARAHKPR